MSRIKYLSFIIILFVIFISGSCKKESVEFTVKGNLANVESGYFFIILDNNDSLKIDSVYVDDKGGFIYKNHIDTLTMASLFFNNNSLGTSIFIDKKWNVEVKGDVMRPDLIEVNGGDVNNDLTGFKKSNRELFTRRADLLNRMGDSGTDPGKMLEYSTELKNVNFELTNRAKEYIDDNPGRIASVVLLSNFFVENSSADLLDKELSTLEGVAATFPLTYELRAYTNKIMQSQIGAMAPNIVLEKEGKAGVDLNYYRGKYVYLMFASQNGEMYNNTLPALIDAYKDLKSKNTEFITLVVDIDSQRSSVKIPDKVKWPVFFDNKGWASDWLDKYNIIELPYTILISPEGKIMERGLPVIALSEKIKDTGKK